MEFVYVIFVFSDPICDLGSQTLRSSLADFQLSVSEVVFRGVSHSWVLSVTWAHSVTWALCIDNLPLFVPNPVYVSSCITI
jgi:hypothetical protein